MSEDKEFEILKTIEKITTTGKRFLDEPMMKNLKKICKISDVYVNYAYYALMTQLRKNHSEVRLSALLAMNELFCRSSCFRKLLELELEEFLQLVAETDPDSPLPLPKPAAKELKLKGLEFMQNWCTKFGDKYTRLQLALTYLKKCKKVDFNDMEARNAAERERQRQEEERQLRVMNEKVSKVKSEMQEFIEGIISIHTQMESCFRLLIPHPTEFFSPSDFETSTHGSENKCITSENKSIDMIEANVSTDAAVSKNEVETSISDLRHHGLYDMKKTITIEITEKTEIKVDASEDTLPIIENLNDLHRQISTKYFPAVSKWLKILTKASDCTDTLKKAIDIKQMLESILIKYKELKINPQASNVICDDDNDDDEFEEVKEKEGFEAAAQEPNKFPKQFFDQPSCSKDNINTDPAFLWKLKHHEDDAKDPTSAVSTLSKRLKYKSDLPNVSHPCEQPQKKHQKAELLEKAPVLPYDIDLYHWEEEKPLVPEVVKFDSLHKFWETKNDDDENETLKEFQVASLRTRKIDFSGKFEPVKWACRAPLPNGKLCPRKDRYKCPFHGKIIKRDFAGNPVDAPANASESTTKVQTEAIPDWQDPALLKDIEATTGINLEIPKKRTKKGKNARSKNKKNKKDGLTDIKTIKNTTRQRLSKKILKRYKHYARKLDDMERKRFNDKFGDQWNYY